MDIIQNKHRDRYTRTNYSDGQFEIRKRSTLNELPIIVYLRNS